MEAPVTAAPPPNSSTPPPPVPLHPAVAPSVQLGFTILYTTSYAGLFLVVYAQLWLLHLYRHKRWSYQSVFLFLCLLWAALRTTLFSFYFHNAVEANHLPVAVYWLLYCFPVCLQFFTLSLINLYFTQVGPGRKGTGTHQLKSTSCLLPVSFFKSNVSVHSGLYSGFFSSCRFYSK